MGSGSLCWPTLHGRYRAPLPPTPPAAASATIRTHSVAARAGGGVTVKGDVFFAAEHAGKAVPYASSLAGSWLAGVTSGERNYTGAQVGPITAVL